LPIPEVNSFRKFLDLDPDPGISNYH